MQNKFNNKDQEMEWSYVDDSQSNKTYSRVKEVLKERENTTNKKQKKTFLIRLLDNIIELNEITTAHPLIQ